MSKKKNFDLSPEQQTALDLLESGENVFLTGEAGSGKSHLVRAFMSNISAKDMPILASTGAAAVLVGGRTFHSFFGIGIMEGGAAATLAKALKDTRVLKRISLVEGFILDEVSMIPADALAVAERISQAARGSSLPWGGLRVIVVGDFAQLPPVVRGMAKEKRAWAFQTEVWEKSNFQSCLLNYNHRVSDQEFLSVLSDVRVGKVTEQVRYFLNSRLREHDPDDKSTRLFPRRDQSECFNQSELAQIQSKSISIPSIYIGEEKFQETLRKMSPVPAELILKKGCRVMFLQNDPQRRWVNGTRGVVRDFAADKIVVEKSRGREVTVEKTMFSIQNAEGKVIASVINFPLTLAYATTIHKSQGATLDELWVDLSRLWEPGHAYVALSRLRTQEGLRLLNWTPSSFVVDQQVIRFYESLKQS